MNRPWREFGDSDVGESVRTANTLNSTKQSAQEIRELDSTTGPASGPGFIDR